MSVTSVLLLLLLILIRHPCEYSVMVWRVYLFTRALDLAGNIFAALKHSGQDVNSGSDTR